MKITDITEDMEVFSIVTQEVHKVSSIGHAGVWLDQGTDRESWSNPNDLFHLDPDKPHRPAPMGFEEILKRIKEGYKACRAGWNGKDMWIQINRPDPSCPMTLPYIYMCTAEGDYVPWFASQTDLLSTDWEILPI